jgi:hypothetical protein
MKRILSFSLAFVFAFSLMAMAATTKVAPIPSPGIKEQNTAASDMYGKIGFDTNGNSYRYVYNTSSTLEYAGQPAFYNFSACNDYTVGPYATSASLEGFAGIWYCDSNGNNTVAASDYGWIQIGGYASAYVSYEGTAIANGDILIGTTNTGGTSGIGGYRYLVRGRPTATAITSTTSEVVTFGNAYGFFKVRYVDAAYSTSTAAKKYVILRSCY